MENVIVFPGISDIYGCGRDFHRGRVEASDPNSEGPLQRGDAGELSEHHLTG